MLKKIIKELLKSKMNRHRYSSSDFRKRKHDGSHPSKYGHGYYKKKHKSSGFFGRSYSS